MDWMCYVFFIEYELKIMKKRIIKLLLFGIILVVICSLSITIVSKTTKNNLVTSTIKSIPDFRFLTLDSLVFSNYDLEPNFSTIFVYFNSDCDYCHNEARSIKESLHKFKNTQIVFVSTEPLMTIEQFSKQYLFAPKSWVYFVQDNNNVFTNTFNAKTIPYTLIYDKNSQLLKQHKGQYSAKGILKVLE